MLGTMMVGNVFFVIIPAHRELIRAKQAGREPDPRWNALRQAALGAQQLPDAAGRVRDALEPLPVHLRARPRVADPRRADGARRVGAALLQSPSPGPERRGGSSRPRPPGRSLLALLIRPASLASNADRACPGLRDRPGDRRRALRSVPLADADAARVRVASGRDRARHRGADPARGAADPVGRRRLPRDAARQRDRDDPGRARHARALAGLALASRHARDRRRRVHVPRPVRGGRRARDRRRLPRDRSRSRTGSSTAAGAASRTGSRGATASSASGRRTRPAIRPPASCCSTRAGSARPSCCSRTATAPSARRRAPSPATISRPSSKAASSSSRSAG